jgi:hypothetical protein
MERHDKHVVDGRFREALESQRKENTPLLHFVQLLHSNDLKDLAIFRRFVSFFFQGFVV